ncbi:MAG: MaoC family dehydratase N-terminal domain-containing protein [Oscillospiraceae bacterium]|nr:MaoC family dehydratase N-terminal domain-containing protein [Oscillospiraceae bacterium]
MYLDDIVLNREIPLPPVEIKKEQMVDFARLYDPFRLHYDDEYAKTTRYGQVIAPGVMTFMAVWAKFMEADILGKELIAGKSTHIEWFRPVFDGDTLTGTARFEKVTRRNAFNGIVEIHFDVRNQHGELVLTDVTESVVKYRG